MRTVVLTCGALALLLLPRPTLAAEQEQEGFSDEANPNAVVIQLGGQIEINRYRSGFQLNGAYNRWLGGLLWLDLASSVLVHKNTNWALDGGIKLKWPPTKSRVRPYLRGDLEIAILREEVDTEYVIGARFGGGATYYSSPGFGASLEANISLGPSFGGGTHLASSLELFAGVEFPF